MKKLFVYLESM